MREECGRYPISLWFWGVQNMSTPVKTQKHPSVCSKRRNFQNLCDWTSSKVFEFENSSQFCVRPWGARFGDKHLQSQHVGKLGTPQFSQIHQSLIFLSFSLLKWPKIDPENPHVMVKLRLHTPKLCISHPCLGVRNGFCDLILNSFWKFHQLARTNHFWVSIIVFWENVIKKQWNLEF